MCGCVYVAVPDSRPTYRPQPEDQRRTLRGGFWISLPVVAILGYAVWRDEIRPVQEAPRVMPIDLYTLKEKLMAQHRVSDHAVLAVQNAQTNTHKYLYIHNDTHTHTHTYTHTHVRETVLWAGEDLRRAHVHVVLLGSLTSTSIATGEFV